jgi:hypothetical protein
VTALAGHPGAATHRTPRPSRRRAPPGIPAVPAAVPADQGVVVVDQASNHDTLPMIGGEVRDREGWGTVRRARPPGASGSRPGDYSAFEVRTAAQTDSGGRE